LTFQSGYVNNLTTNFGWRGIIMNLGWKKPSFVKEAEYGTSLCCLYANHQFRWGAEIPESFLCPITAATLFAAESVVSWQQQPCV